jgi:CheY-like chemotaxis protein
MRQKPIRILLVEDNLHYAKLISSLLEEGMDVTIVHTTLLGETVKALTEQTFDVVLLDLNLLDSPQLGPIRSVRGIDPIIPIIVQTSIVSSRIAEQVLEQGAQVYIPKEKITLERLTQAIHSVLPQVAAVPG